MTTVLISSSTPAVDDDDQLFDRDRWDRPLVPDPQTGDPVPYMRTSKFAGLLSPPYLETWHLQWGLVGGLLDPGAAVRAAMAHAAGDSAEAGRIARDLAHAAGMNEARDRGSARHAAVRRLITAGEIPDGLDRRSVKELRRVADAVLSLGDLHSVETPLICDEWRCAGSADYIGSTSDGAPFIADLKTGKKYSDSIHSWAVQTVTYARSVTYRDKVRGDWVAPTPPKLYIVHAPQDDPSTVDVIEIDPTAAKQLAERAYAIAQARHAFRTIRPHKETVAA